MPPRRARDAASRDARARRPPPPTARSRDRHDPHARCPRRHGRPSGDLLAHFRSAVGWSRVPVMIGTTADENKTFMYASPHWIRRWSHRPALDRARRLRPRRDAPSRMWKATGATRSRRRCSRPGSRRLPLPVRLGTRSRPSWVRISRTCSVPTASIPVVMRIRPRPSVRMSDHGISRRAGTEHVREIRPRMVGSSSQSNR